MKKIIFGAFMLVITSLNIFAQNTGKITGKVVFGGDRSPLHDVSIKINELNKTTFTDTAGNYVFTNVPAGKYTLIAHQEGLRIPKRLSPFPPRLLRSQISKWSSQDSRSK
jgi:hypothetical protein